MDNIFESKQYRSSKNAYTLQCMFEYFISILSTDAFLAKLLKDIGLNDATTGLISSLITVTFFFQLFSIPIAGKLKNIKKPIIIFDTISQLLFASLYFIPFSHLGIAGKGVAVTVMILLAYLMLYLNNSICYKWGNAFVSPNNRGSYSATKEMISLIAGVFFTLGAGYVTDRFESSNNLHGAFLFLAITMVVICVCNFICLSSMKELTLSESNAKQSVKEIIDCTFLNKNFRNTMILTALTQIAQYLTIGFMGTYKTVDLGLSVGKIQIINVVACLGRFAISKPFGKYSDKTTYSKGYFLGNVILIFAFIAGIFASKDMWWLIVLFTVFYQMSFAGTCQNTFLMAYSYVDDEHILSAMAVNNSIRGVAGFLASIVGSRILSAVQNSQGTNMAGQQILCVISAVVVLIALIFNKAVVSKQVDIKKQ